VLASPQFCNSKRYPALLRYVVEQTLLGHGDEIKERTVGIDVFGRTPDYDTNLDTIVIPPEKCANACLLDQKTPTVISLGGVIFSPRSNIGTEVATDPLASIRIYPSKTGLRWVG
jgi:hypothetical protein